MENVLIVNIVSLVLINNKVNEQKEFCVSRRYAHFLFDGAKLRIIRGIFAKNRALTIEFNRFLDKVLSISFHFRRFFSNNPLSGAIYLKYLKYLKFKILNL